MFAFSSPQLYIFLMTNFFLLSLFMALIFKLNASVFGIYFGVRSDIGVWLNFWLWGGTCLDSLVTRLHRIAGGPLAEGWIGWENFQRAGQRHSTLGPQPPGAAGNPECPALWAPGGTGTPLGCVSEPNTEALSS